MFHWGGLPLFWAQVRSLSECQDKLPLSDEEVDIVTFILLLFSSSVLHTPAPNQVSM